MAHQILVVLQDNVALAVPLEMQVVLVVQVEIQPGLVLVVGLVIGIQHGVHHVQLLTQTVLEMGKMELLQLQVV